ncbi:MAG: hypothetical protein CMJ24_10225 [Phycisphaerae bacterium]|nr:hypothetical protein [Phycisphaerae bacterium]MAB83792.1 hypothetical protein [Phycisphaerae bacterium]MDG1898779.1 hypothetical protein [Phycisphaerales bacterium]|tara:strand:- start:7435 stop:9039 length:1605 start_codon:yes stop_codon:yes gene_type:complete
MKHATLGMTVAAFGMTTMSYAATWTVGPGAAYDFPLIQQAITAATPGDTIEVYPSTYFENLDLLGKDLHIRANAGIGTVTVDGGGAGPVVSCISGETSATLLESLVFTNGNSPNGGGLLADNTSPSVRECHFIRNQATSGGGASLFKSKTIFEKCLFDSNVARARGGHINAHMSKPSLVDSSLVRGQAGMGFLAGFGGAIHGSKTDLHVERCLIAENQSTRAGGGSYYKSSRVFMIDTDIDRNQSHDGGGIFSSDTDLHLTHVRTLDNDAWNNGGGMYHQGRGNVLVELCDIINNRAVRDGAGMLVRKRLGVHEVIGTTMDSNFAGSFGGGICYYNINVARVMGGTRLVNNIAMNGGGIFARTRNLLEIQDTKLEANQAQQDGGGFYCMQTTSQLDRVVFNQNLAGVNGGGMKVEMGTASCTDLEFYGNSAIDFGGASYGTNLATMRFETSVFEENLAGDGAAIHNEVNSRVAVNNCKIRSNQAWSSATAGGGLTTDFSSFSEVGNSLLCGNSAVNVSGLYMDLGGNTFAASCP